MKTSIHLLAALCLLAFPAVSCGRTAVVKSPDGTLVLSVNLAERSYDVSFDGRTVIAGSTAQMALDGLGEAWPAGARVKTARKTGVKEHIVAPFYRQAEFDYSYNALSLDFCNGFGMEWRVSDDGVAYRFTTSKADTLTVLGEAADFLFAEDYELTYCHNDSKSPYKTSFEGLYRTCRLSEGTPNAEFLPSSVDIGAGRVTIAESDVRSYPGAFLRGKGSGFSLGLEFPPYPEKDFIAVSAGARTYPWRILKFTRDDSEIPVDNLIYALSGPCAIGDDLSWIKPGFCSWEWWNDWGLEGVPFKPGINDETYRCYIDFAAAHGLEYVVLDEGWGKLGPGRNLLVPIPTLDLQGLADYAAQKGVRLILWAVFDRLLADADNVFARYEKMGIAGFKPDFYNRYDQVAVEAVAKVAESAARHHMLLDLHGFFPPEGLNRRYPNILNHEGVYGLEACKWCPQDRDMPENECMVAFLRQMAGFCDYTPGAMRNMTRTGFVADNSHPGSMGTRARQVALYGVFDAPLAMLCDSPTNYGKEGETVDFIASIPRDWKKKLVPAGKLGDYIVVARESGTGWYVFGITDWEARDVEFTMDFLPEGEWSYKAFLDADDAAAEPEHYRIETGTLTSGASFRARMAPGGGFVIALRKE